MTTFTYGLEFEVEGISPREAASAVTDAGIDCHYVSNGIHQTSNEWKSVPDGSLNSGAEIVSPVLRDSRLNEAARVTRALKAAGAHTARSAGFHVHVGATAFIGEEATLSESLAAFTLNYYAVHHAIGALVAPTRLSNRFCRVLTRVEAEAEAEYLRDGNRGSRTGDRYCSLNLEALNRHETIEIRLHQSTLNGVKAVAWAQLIASIIEASKAGLDLGEDERVGAWKPVNGRVASRDLDACKALLDTLSSTGHLKPATADWLKGRAALLA